MGDSNDNGNGHHGVVLDFSAKPFSEPEPQQFNGAEILDRVSEFIRRFVHLSDTQARIMPVWIAHTHAIGAFTTTIYMNISSATKQSGKTRLMEVMNLLVSKPWMTGRVSAACLVRKVDQVRPTLLLDETDAAFSGDQEYSEALRGILNTGFSSEGVASCCTGQGANVTYKDFRTFCAKAFAGIGNSLPDTVADRSIPIRLYRKKQSDPVARFRRRKAKNEAAGIKMQLSDWIGSVIDHLRDVEPSLPEQLSDRQQDGMEPLLAIADAAGHEWPDAVRSACVEIFNSEAAEDQGVNIQLLKDVRAIFDAIGEDKISSADLLEKLKEVETSPWADWSKGRGLTVSGVSKLLKPFGIGPRQVRLEDRTLKGYPRDLFTDAWGRYLPRLEPSKALIPPFQSETTKQPASTLTETHFSDRNIDPNVSLWKSAPDPHKHCVVSHISVQKGGMSPNGGKTGSERTLPSCPACGSYAVYREKDGRTSCGTCEAVS
jgi:hypothetical protein